MSNIDLQANRHEKLSQSQRRRLRTAVVTNGGCMTLLILGILFCVIILLPLIIGTGAGNPSSQSLFPFIIFFFVLALALAYMTLPYFRYTRTLLADLREGRVMQDCGVLTLEVYSHYSRQGFSTQRFSYIWVDGDRHYRWNNVVQGGFEKGEDGCVYFTPHSHLVLAIEPIGKE